MSERDHPEGTLPHQLRMMAVGQVTAGIIHDANNALAVAVWSLERSARTLPAGSKDAESAKTAINSAMKAAAMLQRVLEYSGHSVYDPGLVNLAELLSRIFVAASASVGHDVSVSYEASDVGPVIIDATMLELGLLDLVTTLSRSMSRNGTILLKAMDLPAGELPPPEAADARIVLSLRCDGLPSVPSLQSTLLQHFAEHAKGWLTAAVGSDDRCEIRLYLPRAVASSADGTAFV